MDILKLHHYSENTMGSLTFFREVMEAYLEMRWGLSATYRADLVRAVRQFEKWHGRQVALENLNENLLGRFLRAHAETHSPTSTNNRRRQLISIWKFGAEELRVLPPPRKIPKLKEPLRIPEAWTLEECERIFAAAARKRGFVADIPAGDWWLCLLLIVYWTGERINAIRQIHCSDYDQGRMALRIRPETQKTRRERIFFLPPEIHAAIMRIEIPERDLLLPFDRHPRRLWPKFQRILLEAGIKHDTTKPMSLFHKLRRTSGTLCELNGGNGSRHLGNTDAVFRKSYFSPNLGGNWQSEKIPVPKIKF